MKTTSSSSSTKADNAKRKVKGNSSKNHASEKTASKSLKRSRMDLDEIAMLMWEHYNNFVDSNDGDWDELQEILEIHQKHHSPTITSLAQVNTPADLIPLLVSLAATCLCDNAINYYLHQEQQQQSRTLGNNDKNQNKIDTNNGTVNGNDELDDIKATIQDYLRIALETFPLNANAWSMAANWGRMTRRLKVIQVAAWYIHAADLASRLQKESIQTLTRLSQAVIEIETNHNTKSKKKPKNALSEIDLREWIEAIALNQMCGVEYYQDSSDDDDDDDDDTKSNESHGQWSVSTVESTSRFMAAMQLSVAGLHEQAKKQLVGFRLTHRLHPTLWDYKTLIKNQSLASTASITPKCLGNNNFVDPCIFTASSPDVGILPKDLYDRLCQVFAPNAAYWSESNYTNRGYYSYFIDKSACVNGPNNLVEDVIHNYLLPNVRRYINNDDICDTIVGYEWWVHTRPIQANLGHNLHFDTDEALLAQTGEITHPIVSSVLYLTGGGNNNKDNVNDCGGGATIVLDQDPNATSNAKVAWLCEPTNNSFMCFPGQLLHGVLPCPGKSKSSDDDDKVSSSTLLNNYKPNHNDLWSMGSDDDVIPHGHRLTFMVGFWTRNVPEKMKDRHLYGPCGPLPPRTKDHTWVDEICINYDNSSKCRNTSTSTLKMQALPRISPVWEELPKDDDDVHNDSQPLIIPKALDHRFFVHNAPACFRKSLFEKDDDDLENEEDDDEEEEEDN